MHWEIFIKNTLCQFYQEVYANSNEDKIMHNQDILCEDIEPFIEWLLISIAKCIAGDNEATLAKLQKNMQLLTLNSASILDSVKVETLVTAVFYELICPVKHANFAAHEGLYALMSSDMYLFC